MIERHDRWLAREARRAAGFLFGYPTIPITDKESGNDQVATSDRHEARPAPFCVSEL
jgi:hypothetical protein